MPRKKKEEELETEGTSAETSTHDNTVQADSVEDVQQPEKTDAISEEYSSKSSVLNDIAETVGTAVGSAAAMITGGVSSVVSAVTGGSSSVENEQSKKRKRAERIGIVQSDKMTKTVTVRVERQVKHPIYRKFIKRRKNFMAHDEQGAAIGDKVRIVETRPMSAKKRWRVVEIIQKAER